jgi:flagellar motor component MotA
MTIEKYSDKYYADVIAVITNFYNEAAKEYDIGGVNLEVLKSEIIRYSPNSFLLIIDGKCEGVFAGVEVSSLLNKSKIYQEIVWYVNEKYRKCGVFMLHNAMNTLKKEGFTSLIMACLHNSKTEKLFRLYEQMGFKAIETHFQKEL